MARDTYPKAPMFNLQVILVSTREGRKGPAVAEWLVGRAREHGRFQVELIDLADVNLPLFDEPRHPRLGKYEHEHTKRWSAIVDRADAFVFVTPEYNYSAPPSLVNALDYLNREWAYKPVAFVSYGGVSGGTRSVQMAKQTVTALKMMPIPEAISIPFFVEYLDPDTGAFDPGVTQEKAATAMLDELLKWTGALKPLRAG
ncbi:MAG TPA: NADPH-dependent FMN reductase [Longimicrobiaceae bacterium]|nr:NADPH-dependent FMN reductase [Longimicrobiaceae bacterium]